MVRNRVGFHNQNPFQISRLGCVLQLVFRGAVNKAGQGIEVPARQSGSRDDARLHDLKVAAAKMGLTLERPGGIEPPTFSLGS